MVVMTKLITELGKIRGALGRGSGTPRRPPSRRARPESAPERVIGDPLIDSSDWEVDDPDLWQEKCVNARQSIQSAGASPDGSSQSGIEALAWYESFHNDQSAWGIYIPISSLALFDALYLAHLPFDRERRLQIAWRSLLLHEQLHFAVDYACACFELMLTAPIRKEFTGRFLAEPPLRPLEKVESYLEVEEALANAYMLRRLKRSGPAAVFAALEQFVIQQPAGYCDGAKTMTESALNEAAAETMRSYLALWAFEHGLNLHSPILPFSPLLALEDDALIAEVPVYVFDDGAEVGLAPGAIRLVHCIVEVVETDAFANQFERQQPAIRKDWNRKKEAIKVGLPAPPRFEKLKNWDQPTWSLRLRDGHRVHLEPPSAGAKAWRAVAIGAHKEMGHG